LTVDWAVAQARRHGQDVVGIEARGRAVIARAQRAFGGMRSDHFALLVALADGIDAIRLALSCKSIPHGLLVESVRAWQGVDIQCRVAGVSCDNECHFLPLRVSRNARNASIGPTDFHFIAPSKRMACSLQNHLSHICDK
jgi:hypothetical protein